MYEMSYFLVKARNSAIIFLYSILKEMFPVKTFDEL